MAESSGIAWCTSTFNPWIGCQDVSPGCKNCYAEELDRRRFSKTMGGGTKEIPILHFGPGAPRYRTSRSNWQQPLAWDRRAARQGGVWRVFCASLADVYDNQAPDEWRADLWELIAATPHLTWLLCTKRVGNIPRMVPPSWMAEGFPTNVRQLISVVNQEEADRDVPRLLALPCKNGVSYEPALGPVEWLPWLAPAYIPTWRRGYQPNEADYRGATNIARVAAGQMGRRFIEWIIHGGESSQGQTARRNDLEWAHMTRVACDVMSVPFFEKQLGSLPYHEGEPVLLEDRSGSEPAEWPDGMYVQQFPDEVAA